MYMDRRARGILDKRNLTRLFLEEIKSNHGLLESIRLTEDILDTIVSQRSIQMDVPTRKLLTLQELLVIWRIIVILRDKTLGILVLRESFCLDLNPVGSNLFLDLIDRINFFTNSRHDTPQATFTLQASSDR